MTVQLIQSDFKKFAIGVNPLKETKDEPSIMLQYLSQIAVITQADESMTLSVLLQSQDVITGLQVKNEAGEWVEAVDRQVNEEMNRRVEQFVLNEIPTTLAMRVQYEAKHEGGVFRGDEPLRLVFNPTTIQSLEDAE